MSRTFNKYLRVLQSLYKYINFFGCVDKFFWMYKNVSLAPLIFFVNLKKKIS